MAQFKQSYEVGLVSIIIPVFNRADLLAETLDSICLQTYTKWECIIVDDGSSDDTCKVASDYVSSDNRIRLISRPASVKKGANGCRNYGFQLAQGEFIQWFDSDDLMSSDLLENKIKSMTIDSPDMVICRAKYFSSSNPMKFTANSREILIHGDVSAFEFLAGDAWFQTSQCLIHRRILEGITMPFNPLLPRNQETELFMRLLLKEPSIANAGADCSVYIRVHDQSISGAYQEATTTAKNAMDLPAYKLMFSAFKKNSRVTSEVSEYFSHYFFRCLKQMDVWSLAYFNLFLFSWYNGLFPPGKRPFRLLIFKMMRN